MDTLQPQNADRNKVAIVMGTYNAQEFLAMQLESIARQTCNDWSLWISDDGSQDASLAIISTFAQRCGARRLTLLAGPRQGFAGNFLSLICNPAIKADYYAYADQDDIWEPDKLARALAILAPKGQTEPAMYCSRTRLVDECNREIGFSPLFRKPPSFANALTQSLGGGNTMIFNHAARGLLLEAGRVNIVSHDWWTYLLVTGCGGCVIYDDYPSVRYRQHANNLVGTNKGVNNKIRRLKMLWRGEFRQWVDRNIMALLLAKNQLKRENIGLLHTFIRGRDVPLFARLKVLRQTGIYRQTLLGNIGLFFAVIFRKI
ncbi:glycosyltransferase family 2 protein [Sodalis sp. RH22]|uniref:glycosyltransferase family 2 protein n=1 Tax=unclassified Sodalis (in: enterobacteria) TaxID=2636512 RepID=UPI0039B51877